jgi:hypothetical protein
MACARFERINPMSVVYILAPFAMLAFLAYCCIPKGQFSFKLLAVRSVLIAVAIFVAAVFLGMLKSAQFVGGNPEAPIGGRYGE